jgi:serine/threonine protein kinase
MVGTVNYMPPEQATGGEITPRADLYSLGAMLYEMSTGRVPFMGDDDITVISQHVNTPAVAPSWHNSSIPRTLDSLILRLMSKDPDERLQTADEVIIALDAVDLSVADDTHEDQNTSLDSMAGGVFVGRHREMDQLKSIFEDVLSGRGRLVTLVGEPGILNTLPLITRFRPLFGLVVGIQLPLARYQRLVALIRENMPERNLVWSKQAETDVVP